MYLATSWLEQHRHAIKAHVNKFPHGHHRRTSKPTSNAWWIANAAIATIIKSIHIVVMQLQGQRLTFNQEEFQVQPPIVDLMVTIGVRCDSTNHVDQDPAINVIRGRWSTSLTEIIGFLYNLGHFYMTTLESLDDPTCDDLLHNVYYFIFDILEEFTYCIALRNNNNDKTNTTIPRMYLFELVRLKGRDIAKLVSKYRDRLEVLWASAEIDTIDSKFSEIPTNYNSDHDFKMTIDKIDYINLFNET